MDSNVHSIPHVVPFHYATYVLAWTLAIVIAVPLSRLLPQDIGLSDIETLWWQQFDFSNVAYQVGFLGDHLPKLGGALDHAVDDLERVSGHLGSAKSLTSHARP